MVAPQPPERIPLNLDAAGNLLAYPRLALEQRAVRQTRLALSRSLPRLPANARIVRESFPQMIGVALAGDRSLHAWYRDSTCRWVRLADLLAAGATRVDGMVAYEPTRTQQFVAIEPASLRAACDVFPSFRSMQFEDAVHAVDRAKAFQQDTTAAQYLATLEVWRAMALVQLGRLDEAAMAATNSERRFYGNGDARYVLASIAATRQDWVRVHRLLELQLRLYPDDRNSLELDNLARRALDAVGR
jgi:hypothetical protein